MSFRNRQSGSGGANTGLIFALVAWWGWMPVASWLWGLMLKHAFGGIGTWYQSYHLFFVEDFFAANAGVLGLGWAGWLWFAFGALGTMAIAWIFFEGNDSMAINHAVGGMAVVLLLVSGCGMIGAWVQHDRNKAYFYLQATTLNVEDMNNPPSSLQLLFAQKDAERKLSDNNMTQRIGEQTLVKQATPPDDLWQWEPRSSSFAGALNAFNNRTSTSIGVSPMQDTVTYVYGKDASSARDGSKAWVDSDEQFSRWSVVLDGSKRSRPMAGVAEWRGGQNQAKTCLFDTNEGGQNRFTRAFNGDKENSLRNVLADEYPELVYEDTDIAGYCTGQEGKEQPVVVVSVKKIVGYRNLTVTVPAGVLVLRGSPSGYPAIEYKPTVKPGEFPVPTYPISTVVDQRAATDWWAGRGNKDADGGGFGFEPSSAGTQSGNNSEYILRSKKDGRIYAVTPLKAKSSTTQLFINFTVTPVDAVTDGALNPLNSYVLSDKNKNVVSPKQLEDSAIRAVTNASFDPRLQNYVGNNFLGAGNGQLEEATPLTPTKYRYFGVNRTGATVIYVDIDASQVNPTPPVIAGINGDTGKVDQPVTLSNTGTTPTTGGNPNAPSQPTVNVNCDGKDVRAATNQELQACLNQGQATLKAYQDELLRRLTEAPQPAASAAPAPSATR
jgi:hypothetical protein